MSDLTICKSFLVVWDENGLFIWFIVIDGKFDNSVPEYDVLQYSPNPPTSVVITVRDHKLGRMVEKELTIVNRNGQMVLLSSPVSGKSGNCVALNFAFDDQGVAAAVVLDKLKYLFQFLTLQFWKEQLVIFSDNVSSLSHPDPAMTPQQQCVLQLVQSLQSDSNPTEGVIRLLVNVLTAEDVKRSAVTLVQRLYECYLNFISTQHLVVPAFGSCDEQNGDHNSLSDTPKEPIHDQQKMLNGNHKEEGKGNEGATGDVNSPITANLQETGELSSGPSLSKSRDSVPSIQTSKSREGPVHFALVSASKLESGPGMKLEGIPIRNESSLLVESRSVALEDADLVVVPSSGRLPTTLGVTGEEQTMENCAADVPFSQECTDPNPGLNELVSSSNSDVLEERQLLMAEIPLPLECTESTPVSDELVTNKDCDVHVAKRGPFVDGEYVVPVTAASHVQGAPFMPATGYGASYGFEVRMMIIVIVMISIIMNIFIDFCL